MPGVTGGGGLAGGVEDVAEVSEGDGFVVAVAEFPEEAAGLPVAGDRLGVPAEVVVGVAKAVPGVRLSDVVVEFLEQHEGLPAGGERLLVVTEPGVIPADVVEGVGLPTPIVGGPR